MEIHGDGQQIRTFTYVDRHRRRLRPRARTPEARGEIINIGGTEPTTILELAEVVQSALGASPPLRATFVPYETLPGNYQDVRHRVPDTTKARELLGFEAEVPLADGLATTIDWHERQRLEGRQVVPA